MTKQHIDLTWTAFREVVADKFGASVDGVHRDAAFIADLGADSLDMIQVVMEIEDRYQIEIPQDEASRLVTVGDAFDYIVARMSP
jgi:acyl carrier protein